MEKVSKEQYKNAVELSVISNIVIAYEKEHYPIEQHL